MKWSTAVARVVSMARECDELDERLALFDSAARLTGLWVYGPVVDGEEAWPRDLEYAAAAVVFDVTPDQVPWYARPGELERAVDMMGWGKRPVHLMYRSAALLVWNHHIVRPLRLWDADSRIDERALAALSAGATEPLRETAPAPEELREQLERERQVSYAALTATTAAYDQDRGGPRHQRAEPLWEAAAGYVDLTQALEALEVASPRET